MLVNAIRVGAAAPANNMLAAMTVCVPYFKFRESIVEEIRALRVSLSSPENKLNVCKWSGTRFPKAIPA